MGECFLAEAGIPGGDAVKEPYKAMHAILREVCLQPWTSPALENDKLPNLFSRLQICCASVNRVAMHPTSS